MVAHIILYEDGQFRGAHKHVFRAEENLNVPEESFNDRTSSIVVLDGTWEFFEDPGFHHKTGRTLGPGMYPDVTELDMRNDSISSLRPV